MLIVIGFGFWLALGWRLRGLFLLGGRGDLIRGIRLWSGVSLIFGRCRADNRDWQNSGFFNFQSEAKSCGFIVVDNRKFNKVNGDCDIEVLDESCY